MRSHRLRRRRADWRWIDRRLAGLFSVLAVAALGCSSELNMGEVFAQNLAAGDAGPRDDAPNDAPHAPNDATACYPVSKPCDRSTDCCSRTCISGVCVPPGTCQLSGTACSSSTDCCSGRCQADPPVITSKICGSSCSADGVPCIRAQNCCSLACFNGVCGGGTCKIWGDTCSVNSDCCTNICDPTTHKCNLAGYDGNQCQPAGETCAPDAGVQCCYGCDTALGRCAAAPTLCRGIGAACTTDGDCCRGACLPDDRNVKVCQIQCLADGASCTSGVECCSFGCAGSPAKCGPPMGPACAATGARCVTPTDCCSQSCDDGYCHPSCGLAGASCSVEDDCCSELCVGGVCQR